MPTGEQRSLLFAHDALASCFSRAQRRGCVPDPYTRSHRRSGNRFERRSAMRKLLAPLLAPFLALCAALIALVAGNAWAADLRFPPPASAYPGYPPPAYLPPALPQWSGCYVGLNVGGAWANINVSSIVGGTLTANPAGVAGGGQIGCDIQFDQWVFGVRDCSTRPICAAARTFSTAASTATPTGSIR